MARAKLLSDLYVDVLQTVRRSHNNADRAAKLKLRYVEAELLEALVHLGNAAANLSEVSGNLTQLPAAPARRKDELRPGA